MYFYLMKDWYGVEKNKNISHRNTIVMCRDKHEVGEKQQSLRQKTKTKQHGTKK